MKLAELKAVHGEIHEIHKGKPRDQSEGSFKWTEDNDEKLHDLIQGNIDDFCETEIYGNAIAAQIEFLTTKHNIQSSNHLSETNLSRVCTGLEHITAERNG